MNRPARIGVLVVVGTLGVAAGYYALDSTLRAAAKDAPAAPGRPAPGRPMEWVESERFHGSVWPSLQGFMFDRNGQPLNGVFPMTLRFYSDADDGATLWEATRPVVFRDGAYAVQADVVQTIPPELAHHRGALFLGVQILGDREMLPRLTVAPATLSERK